MPLPYLHYDVFTAEPLLGNQLAVFTDGRTVPAERMQRIAREMNFSESTFVLPAGRDGTDVRVRIFTPHVELPMAGHPTVGTAFALAEQGVIAAGRPRVVFDLGIGPTPVDLEWAGGRLRFAWMSQGAPVFGPPIADRAAVAAALDLTAGDLAADLPVQEVSCGVPFLFVPLRDRDAVDRAVGNAGALRTLPLRDAASPFAAMARPAVFLFAVSAQDAPETVYSRMFGPHIGIVEDPATGSASGPLGCYLVQHGIVRGDASRRIVSAQGVAMGRASRIHIDIEGTAGAIARVRIGGGAVLIGRGELLV